MHKSYQRRISCERCFAVMARQAGSARLAASIALRTSSVVREGTVPSTDWSAGLVTSMVLSLDASTQLPSIWHCWRNREGFFSFMKDSCKGVKEGSTSCLAGCPDKERPGH